MATVLKMFKWLSISFGQGCLLQEPVLIFQIASQLSSRRANHVIPLKPGNIIGGQTAASILAELSALKLVRTRVQSLQLET